MPILLQYAPIGAGAVAAQNVASEKERQIREQERLRREQAYEEQRRYDEAMQLRNREQADQEAYHRQSLDLAAQRNAGLDNYRGDQLDLSRQKLENADTPAEKWRRLKERLAQQGDLQGSRLAAQREMEARRNDFHAGQNDLNRSSREGIANNAYDQRATQFDQSMEYKKSRDQEHDDLMRELSGEKMKALTAAANARDEKTRQSALTAAADLDYRAAVHSTDRHFREKPKPDPITGQIDPQAMAAWSNQHRSLIEQESQAKTAAERIRNAAPINPTAGPNPQMRRDTPAAFQNDPLSEGPVIGQGGAPIGAGPSMPQGMPGDVMGEFNPAPQDPQLAAFQQFYNNLPPGAPYTAPDGTQRVKK